MLQASVSRTSLQRFIDVPAVVFACGLLLAVLTSSISAQVITGTILGTIRDSSGGAIPAARITVTNTGTNVSTTSQSSAAGEFTIPLLPPGQYKVEVEAEGFRTFRKTGIQLAIDMKYRVDVDMMVGELASTVEVVADAQALQTDSADLSATITPRAISSLPNVGRNPMQYLVTVSGITPRQGFESPDKINVGDDSRRQFSNVSVNGSRPNASEIYLDGAPNTNMANNEVSVLPNIDAVGELRVVTNNYSAEFGRVSGGVFSFGTKSGTNTFHGSLYDNIRNPVLNANSFGNNSFGRNPDGTPVNPKGKFNVNQFGGSFSGPVVLPKYNGRNRTFFFTSYEGLRSVNDDSAWLTVPTPLEREGDFSQTRTTVRDPATGQLITVPRNIFMPFPHTTKIIQVTPTNFRLERQQFSDGGVLNKIPKQYINPLAQQLINFYPLPNVAPRQPDGTENYFDANSTRIRTDQFIAKVDQNFTQTHRTFFRFSNDWTKRTPANRFREGNPDVANAIPVTQNNPAVTVGHTWIKSAMSIVDLRANLTRINLVQKPRMDFDLAAMGFSREMLAVSPTNAFPYITGIGNYQAMGTGQVVYRDNHNTNYSVTGSFTKILNTWTLKFGGEYRSILANLFQPTFPGMTFSVQNFTRECAGSGCPTLPVTNQQGWSAADFLIGALDGQRGGGQFVTGDPSMALKWSYYGFFSQNDWRVTRKLTVNLGVRWDYQAPGTERYNRLSQFNRYGTNITGTPGVMTFSGVNGVPRGQTRSDFRNWAPRVGIAYRADSKTVIRTAYGISYDQITGVGTGSDGFGILGFGAPAFMRIRPQSGLDILERPFTDAFNGGGTILGTNPQNPALLGNSLIGIERDAPVPYVQQWNFTIERELPGNVTMQVSYVGTKGTRLITMQTQVNNVNSIPEASLMAAMQEYIRTGANPLSSLVPNPFYGIIPAGNPAISGPTIARNQLERAFPAYGGINMFNLRTGSSSYNGLQVSARRSFRSGSEIGGHYTWSKNIDFGNHFTVLGPNTQNGGGSTSFNLRDLSLDRSVANSDVPHRAVFNYVLALPLGRGHKLFGNTPVVKDLLSGWRISGITSFSAGLPLAITGGPFGRVDLVKNPVLSKEYRCYGDGKTPCKLPNGTSIVVPERRLLYFDPTAYQSRVLEVPRTTGQGGTLFVEEPYYWGTAPRFDSRLRGFGVMNTDLSIARDFSLGESRKFILRADASNAFNRTQFGDAGITKGFGSPNLDPARGTLGLSTSSTFGTAAITTDGRSPRYIQVTARFEF